MKDKVPKSEDFCYDELLMWNPNSEIYNEYFKALKEWKSQHDNY